LKSHKTPKICTALHHLMCQFLSIYVQPLLPAIK
jgi:hypothetical protein